MCKVFDVQLNMFNPSLQTLIRQSSAKYSIFHFVVFLLSWFLIPNFLISFPMHQLVLYRNRGFWNATKIESFEDVITNQIIHWTVKCDTEKTPFEEMKLLCNQRLSNRFPKADLSFREFNDLWTPQSLKKTSACLNKFDSAF